VFSRLGEMNEIKSSIPSRMKRISTLDVKIDGSLKVKRCTLVITNYEASSTLKEKIQRDKQAPFHPVTVREAIGLEDDTKLAEALEIPEM